MSPTLYRADSEAGDAVPEAAYHVRLDPGSGTDQGFDGPLELLLRMVRDGRADPLRIEISRLTRQYLDALEVMEMLDLEVGSEFLKLATALLRIKAHRLLPRPRLSAEGAGGDALAELEARLADYSRYRDAARKLRRNLEERRAVWSRPPSAPSANGSSLTGVAGAQEFLAGGDVDLFAVVEAFRRVVARARARPSPPLPRPQVSVEELIRRFETALPPGTSRDFEDLLFELIGADLAGNVHRPVLIAAFLALLELARRRRVSLTQEQDFGAIRIGGLAPPPPDE